MSKTTLVLSLSLLLAGGLFAQSGNNALHAAKGGNGAKSISFPASNIQYWVGTGSNSTVVIIGWDDNPNGNFALAWGVHWNGNVTAVNMLDTIATYDSRVSYNIGSGFVTYIGYNDGTLVSGSEDSYWCYTVNDNFAQAYSIQPIANGDVMEISSSCMFSLSSATAASNPNGPADETPEDATIAASDILYWVGNGDNEVIMAVNWADTALAWGYRFDGDNVGVATMMDAIATADPRFSYIMGSWGIDDINFTTDNGTLGITQGNYWWSLKNGQGAMGVSDLLVDGDLFKWGDLSVAVVTDSTWIPDYNGYWDYSYVWPYTITPVDTPTIPAAEDATIAASDILYWVGNGSNEVIMAVNWADTALAWGYRFDGDNVGVIAMMDSIAAADPRFSYVMGSWGVDDINFTTDNGTLGITQGNYWWSLKNGQGAMGVSDLLVDGDFFKWGDLSVAVVTDSTWIPDYNGYWDYTYVWPYTIHPVSVPSQQPEVGPFCGAVGTEGCTAIPCNDSRIKGWATGCTIVRGSQNLSNPDAPTVTYGTESEAIGAATVSTTDVVSLGDGGYATVTFDIPISDGEGFDFAVYENSFSDGFLELAFVEVSSDGERFVRFPATSLTQTNTQIGGNGPVDPTFINNLAGKYRVGYGTPFDLSELSDSNGIDIHNITHVRIVDVVGSIDPQYGTYDAFGHIINDPFPTISYSAGFDLDGVCVLNSTNEGIASANASQLSVCPNPTTGLITIRVACENDTKAMLFDMSGRLMGQYTLSVGDNNVDISSLPKGVYLLRTESSIQKVVKK